jgi:hypothetical protein
MLATHDMTKQGICNNRMAAIAIQPLPLASLALVSAVVPLT